MNHKLVIRIAVFAALVLGPLSAHPETSSFRQGVNGYTGTVDTYVRMDQPTNQFANSTFVHIDNDSPIAHGLLRFDQIFGEGPGQVPPWADLFSARLIFYTTSDSDPVWFHRMLVPWDETNTWNDLSTSGPGLQADGIEMAATPDFTFTPSFPVPRVDSFDVTATVYGWLVGSFPNYGWGITNEIANGWMFSSSENSTNTNRPVLEITFHSGPRPIEILTHPTNVTTTEGDSVTFSVVASGLHLTYMWFKDALPITNATNATYTIPAARRTDEGNYHVEIRHVAFSFPVVSSNAFLTVLQGSPPYVICAYGTNDNVTLFVVFSEIVTNATDPANYAVFPEPGGEYLSVATAVHPGGASEGTVIVLTLDPTTPFAPGRPYYLSVGGVSDRLGDPIDPTAVTPIPHLTRTIFTMDNVWKFNDSGSDLGTAWRNVHYNDDSWPSGLPLFGFETAALPEPLRTPLNRTNGLGSPIRTYYFRTHFDSPIPGQGLLRFRTVLDDAVALYLNGAEIFRLRLPPGPLNYLTEGTGDAVGDAAYEGPFTVCVTNLLFGDNNTLAAEVHQTGAASPDLIFGMELFSLWSTSIPDCFVTKQPTNQVVEAGSSAAFTVGTDCPELPWSYQWYKGGSPIEGATNATYTISPVGREDDGFYWAMIWASPTYTFQSATARLTVLPPRLRITLAAEGTDIILNWTGSAVLEQTSSLSPGEWSEVEGAVSGQTMPLSGSKFFRLREP